MVIAECHKATRSLRRAIGEAKEPARTPGAAIETLQICSQTNKTIDKTPKTAFPLIDAPLSINDPTRNRVDHQPEVETSKKDGHTDPEEL